jgi:hypothetical protein
MRRYGDPVEVRSHDAAPVGFRWHGRVYLVRAVLARWIERGSWWTGAPAHRDPQDPAGPLSVARAVGAVEHEVWRVEAVAGSVVGVYDLVRDRPVTDTGSSFSGLDPDADPDSDPDLDGRASRWRLVRSLD